MAVICDMTAGKAQVVQGMRQLVAAGCASLLPTPPFFLPILLQRMQRLAGVAWPRGRGMWH